MIQSSCHCGKLKLEIEAELPEKLTSCNCSVCHRYGSLWAYYHPDKVKVVAQESDLDSYSWGDKSLAFVRCKNCGVLSHWKSLDPSQTERMGVNTRLFENVDLSEIQIRRFDGADSWTYLD